MAPQPSPFGVLKVKRKRVFRQLRRLLKVRVWRSYTFREVAVLVVLLCALGGLFLGSHLFQWRKAPLIVHSELWEDRVAAGGSVVATEQTLWQDPPNPEGWAACTRPIEPYHRLERMLIGEMVIGKSGFLQVFLEGGLNQQRIGISNAVVVARLLNAVLVLPELDINPVWNDDSSFGEIFDVTHFITTLSDDVHVITSPPWGLHWNTREYFATGIRPNRVKDAPLHAPPEWYKDNVLPLLKEYGIVAIAPFSHRLAFDGLDANLQKLRCRANFEALRFIKPIRQLGDEIVQRMQSDRSGPEAPAGDPPGKARFLALHLRFDKDMAAHSACYFGGGWRERRELRRYREYAWQGRVEKVQHSEEELRRTGKCPMTPEETGLFLAGVGFSPDTRIYLASYDVYGGEARLAPLRTLFPHVRDKYALASAAELAWFEGHASRLAALDYHVLLQADVMVSAAAGNMHNVLGGHRMFLGPKKTINPDNVLLAQLWSNSSIGWKEFSERVHKGHASRVGQVKLRKKGQSIYTYPGPDCMCSPETNETYRT
ncbi:O-fucosyltransferase family protein [Klebsormidium nitens]|uniref:O-fucosyltransferase family protein n=1 Tax=Klebsormidium nitens TaxID=105231 RepID=A0A1Y1HJL0_KLENI|nr:O-fucosyltransferase family protein [Klebsormidium nitens]|eukprot:GAQ78734.1 O-fucosyltransferase family protein [Klebsormidium nitens]